VRWVMVAFSLAVEVVVELLLIFKQLNFSKLGLLLLILYQ